MKKILILILILILPITALAATLFSDGFESGNLTAWSSNANDGGDLSVTTAAVLHGIYGLNVYIHDTNPKFVRDDTPNSETRYRLRFYIDPNTLTIPDAQNFVIFRARNAADTSMFSFSLKIVSGVYNVFYGVATDTGTTWGSEHNITDAPHCIEIDWKAATAPGANNGFLELIIDGVSKQTSATIDNDTRIIDYILFGATDAIDAGTSGTFYLDDFASNNDGSEIGLLFKWNTATIRKWAGTLIKKWNGI